MLAHQIELSSRFRSQTIKAILAIVLFIIVYLAMIVFGIALMLGCAFISFQFFTGNPGIISALLSLGIVSLGVLVLFFLFKFLFSSHQVDHSHLREITEQEEPQLFALIQDIVDQVGTTPPKHVYLSPEVNASVFYNSSFWSMFLPIRKNLQIGMGLVNTVTTAELTAILAHEFGHFSQRTMKVGSYVYNANQVIYNMLYDNASFDGIANRWASVSGYFAMFVWIVVIIIRAFQWILQKLYGLINVSYMGLSREMEFHADEIAAHVAGYAPLKNSLLRMDLSAHAYTMVVGFYGNKVKDQLKSANVYREQTFAMNFLAQDDGIPIEEGLPQVSIEEQNRYNRSKLVIKDQWASHPSTEERVARLESLGLPAEIANGQSSTSLFRDLEQTQLMLTEVLFRNVTYDGEATIYSLAEFQETFVEQHEQSSYDKRFNGYYDHRDIAHFDIDEAISGSAPAGDWRDFFAEEKQELVLSWLALRNDTNVLADIVHKRVTVKSFDYDGRKYKRREGKELLYRLRKEMQQQADELQENDLRIFRYFYQEEQRQSREPKLEAGYRALFAFDEEFDRKVAMQSEPSQKLSFIQENHQIEEIRKKFTKLEPLENQLKAAIQELLRDSKLDDIIQPETREMLQRYTSQKWTYIGYDRYEQENLNLLFASMDTFVYLLRRRYFVVKKEVLDDQASLF